MQKYLNGIALILVAAGLFTLSYVLYRQEDRGRWIPISHKYDETVIADSYTGRVWSMVPIDRTSYDVEMYDVTDGRYRTFRGKK